MFIKIRRTYRGPPPARARIKKKHPSFVFISFKKGIRGQRSGIKISEKPGF